MVGFQAGLSPTSFHLSKFFSFVSQAGCLWSGSWLACLPLPFICLPVLFICLPGWLLVVGFLAGLSPTSFHVSPTFSHLSSNSSHLSPRLGACGRVPGCLVCNLLSFVSQFFSFVSQAGCLWSGSRLACLICLPLLFICLPGWVLVVGLLASLSPTCFHLSLTSFHLSPRLCACGRVPGWLVSHFLSCVSQFFSCVSQFFSFVSQAGCLWAGSWLACLPLPFMCLPVLFICLPGWCFTEWSPWCWMVWSGSRPACLPLPFICLPVLFICLPGWVLVVGFPAGLSPISFHLFPSSSFVSQAGCLWSGCRLACLPLPFICLALLFTCLPVLFICLPRFWLGWMVWSDSRPACLPLPFICLPVLFICPRSGFPAGLSPTSFHSPIAMLWGLAKLIGGRAPLGHRQSWWADGVPVMF